MATAGLQARLALTRFHDLRHTHATIAITMDLYSHVLPNMQADAVATMDEAL